MDLADQLQKLQTLREQGALTEEEFVLAKKRLLDGTYSPADGVRESGNAKSDSALNQLKLSRTDKWIGGVCGGLAAQTSIPTWSWRILFVLMALLHGIGILAYLLLWIFVPVQTEIVQRVTSESAEVK
ncbi:MAG: PspC domain-containing protein [Usitatibacteraceae bacterium]